MLIVQVLTFINIPGKMLNIFPIQKMVLKLHRQVMLIASKKRRPPTSVRFPALGKHVGSISISSSEFFVRAFFAAKSFTLGIKKIENHQQ